MISYEDLGNFIVNANRYLVLNTNQRNTVYIALDKLVRRDSKKLNRYKEDIEDYCEDLRTDACSKDPKGNLDEEKVILKDAKGNEKAVFKKKYTPEADKKLRKDIREYTRKKMDADSGFEPHFVDVPDDFDVFYRSQFEGFIFKEGEVSKEQKTT